MRRNVFSQENVDFFLKYLGNF